MPDLDEINPHLALWRFETSSSGFDNRWEAWLRKVEELTGLDSLDGDEEEDGYSLDTAYDLFAADFTPEEAAAEFMS